MTTCEVCRGFGKPFCTCDQRAAKRLLEWMPPTYGAGEPFFGVDRSGEPVRFTRQLPKLTRVDRLRARIASALRDLAEMVWADGRHS